MEIQSQNGSNSIGSQTPSTPLSNDSSSALSSDFETFLKMLTTQMENQDPLNPIESSDFAVQLATFSGVEQQIRTNDLLADFIAGNGASGLGQLAGWVGMEARVSGPVAFDGAPVKLSPDIDPASDGAYLIVRDQFGAQISREALPLDAESTLWGGVGADGSPLAEGRYNFEVESINNGQITSTKPVEHYALIQEARLGASGIEVVTSGGVVASAADVSALRSPTP
ncbi:MAG: flagellar hook assembly protein FlgD [Boseongicola sp.]|nr:flagellar hook assembly protein FlgD [Boseongicola sp.]